MTAACIRCGGDEDLMDRGMAPGMTYCKPCRVDMAQPQGERVTKEQHYFYYECDGIDVASMLEVNPVTNPEGAAKLNATERLDVPCPVCNGDHGLDRITAERFAEINEEEDE